MNKAYLIFTQKKNSFDVYVKNLEKLDVKQIQELESFVSFRNGIFDFSTYVFSIQKKLKFDDFVLLLEHLNINARCEENIIIPQNQPRIGFGQYKGMQYNELPNSYMLWLKANYRGQDRDIIDKELKKRNL